MLAAVTSRPIAKLLVRRSDTTTVREKASETMVLPVVTRDELLERCRERAYDRDTHVAELEEPDVEIVIDPQGAE